MKINVLGGGPAGLYFAILMKKQDPSHEIRVFERNPPDATWGWGVVFSGQTAHYLADHDEASFDAIKGTFQHWDTVDIVHKGEHIAVKGNAFSGISRMKMLNILHDRCHELGVEMNFGVDVTDPEKYRDCDLVIAGDGINSVVRETYSDSFKPQVTTLHNKFIWLGTNQLFHGLYLIFRETEHGVFIAHSYKFDDSTSTFIVECGEETWRSAGLDTMPVDEGIKYLETVFADDLGGNPLLSNNSAWINFREVKCETWHHENVILVGDAVHTAHFSIGSGTKLAVETVMALADAFASAGDETIPETLARFQLERKPRVDALQEAAMKSLDVFEKAANYMDLEPLPFVYKFMTRSDRIDYEKLKIRDPEFIACYDEWAAAHA